MEAFVKASTLLLARWIEAGAALVIAVASVRALGSFLFAIGLLAAIAVLRTALNYFLERELRNAEQRDNAGRPSKRVWNRRVKWSSLACIAGSNQFLRIT